MQSTIGLNKENERETKENAENGPGSKSRESLFGYNPPGSGPKLIQMYPDRIEGSNANQIIVPEKSQGLPFPA